MIKLRLLIWGEHPGFFWWAQCNHRCSYKREAEVREGPVMIQAVIVVIRRQWKGRGVEEHRWALEDETDKKKDSPLRISPADTVIFNAVKIVFDF